MRIGIVGAENSHCAAVAQTLNVRKSCGSARVVAVWGETKALAEKAAADGQIPLIVRRPEEMIGKIDGVMVDHRHAKYHVPFTWPFIEAKIPAFVDKPFSFTVAEGWKLIQFARRKGVPVTSYSSVPEQESFEKGFMGQIRQAGAIRTIDTWGHCDVKSKWGGVFFYGIHQVEGILKAFGPGIAAVQAVKAGRGNGNVAAVMTYGNGGPIVTTNLVAEGKCDFVFRAVGVKASVDYTWLPDADSYLPGTRAFLKMFRTGKMPKTPAQLLEPIAVLEALAKSIRTGRAVRVAKLPC